MRALRVCVLVAVITGCGEKPAPDNTGLFVSCLRHSGGELVTADRQQLASYPSTDVEPGAGASLESVSYFSIDVAVRDPQMRQALVFVEDLHADPPPVDLSKPADLLRRARRGNAGVHALIVMPPARDPEAQIGRCEDVAAPDQVYP